MSKPGPLKVHITGVYGLIATEKPVFEICYGVSDNRHRWVDIDHSREVLGFIPQDSHEDKFAAVKKA